MPRCYPPTPVLQPTLEPFVMDSIHHRILAQTLGLTHLPGSTIEGINDVIGRYKAIQYGNRDTTVGNTLAALKGLYRPGGRAYRKAVERLTNNRSGVDDTTLDRLQPLAQAVIDDDPEAPKALAAAAKQRAVELKGLRIEPKTESFRSFCGALRLIFDGVASPSMDRTPHNRAKFALAVFVAAEIEHADFEAHPERLHEYLATEFP
jgi:hypothetical protein